jgi:hypothetical protein
VEKFEFSTDPELVAKVTDVVGLYLAPPENAIVLCVDEKSQVQALDRTQPVLPMQPGLAERRTHDYVRHGTTTLFAALEIATGTVTAAVKPRHRHQEFLAFLKQVAKAYPERPLPPLRLDQDRRPNPQKSQPSDHFKHGPLVRFGAINHPIGQRRGPVPRAPGSGRPGPR